ncbi:MAG TPA: SufD family Fe-S cluster assembly protein, partial [Rudaea sp.]
RFEPDASVSMTNDAQRTTLRLSGDTTRTLHLVFANVPGAAPIQWRRELTIEVEGSDAELIEHHLGEIGADVLGALTSTIRLVEGAELRTVAISDLADSVSLYRRDEVRLAAGAKHCATHALFGGRLQRWDLLTEIGAQAAYVSRGVFALRSRQHVDVHLDACHAARDARSDVAWRGVADQRARGILHGAITVAEGADGADAQLQTKNLLLSPHAEIDAQPVLEIYADEVKATHGATVGQLDERALFYLRSRGIAAADARALLIAGFCRETLADLPDAHLRERIDAILSLHLPQG